KKRSFVWSQAVLKFSARERGGGESADLIRDLAGFPIDDGFADRRRGKRGQAGDQCHDRESDDKCKAKPGAEAPRSPQPAPRMMPHTSQVLPAPTRHGRIELASLDLGLRGSP